MSAVSLIIFSGLFVTFKYSLELISESRSKLTALSLATDRIEYIRSLSYDEVGTQSGIPNGNIPQNRVVNLNGIDFAERVLIEYVDDDADGTGGADTNGILSDYKRAKVEYAWKRGDNATSSFFIVSDIVPRSVETTSGGGSLRVNIFDADVLPLPGINVRLYNDTTTSTIDVTKTTDANGTALFSGAPAASNYEIFAWQDGYSSDQTRKATTSLDTPNTLPVTVLEGDVSTVNFQIDELSDLNLKILTDRTTGDVVEAFDDISGVDSIANATTSGGVVRLTDTGGVYDNSGSVMLDPITPTPLAGWGILKTDMTLPPSTDVKLQFYSSTNTADLIPDGDLPGNSVGLSDAYIDLRDLSVASYPTIVVGLTLSTTDTNNTPSVDELTLSYASSETPLASTLVTITSNKDIGTSSSSPVYKYQISTTTDANGEIFLEDIEWDQYTISLPSTRVISEACYRHPLELLPDETISVDLLTIASTTNKLRVEVVRSDDMPIVDADVRLTRTAYDTTVSTGWCGQAFFGSLGDETDYTLEVSANGYTTQVLSPYSISGETVERVILTP